MMTAVHVPGSQLNKYGYIYYTSTLPKLILLSEMKQGKIFRLLYYTFLTCYILGGFMSYMKCSALAGPALEVKINNTLICIIAARRRGVSYVHTVMQALRDQISIPGVLVDLDDHYTEVQLPDRFVRLVPSERNKENCDPNEGDIGLPNCVTRQQTRDVAVGLRRCTEMAGQHTWVLMLEDDMLPCPGAMGIISSYLSGLDSEAVHIVKFGKFSRAVAFPPPGTAIIYAQAALANIIGTPYDLILGGDWRSGITIVHKGGSLFRHIGTVSTNPYRNDLYYMKKWYDLRKENCGDLL